MASFVLSLSIEIDAPDIERATRKADRILEFVFLDDEVNAVAGTGIQEATIYDLYGEFRGRN